MMQARPLEGSGFFQEFLSDFHRVRRALRGSRKSVWQPPTDVYETDDEIVIKMSVPGVQTDDVRAVCNGEVITVSGVRRGPDPGKVRAYHQMEMRNGYFERSIAIHRPFDPAEAHGEYREGFLYVFVPKAPKSVRRVISIRLTV